MLENILLGCCLLVYAIEDIRTKELSVQHLIWGFGVLMVTIMIQNKFLQADRILGILPGIVLLVTSRLLEMGIGSGDCIIFILTGFILGSSQNLQLLLWSMMLCAMSSIILLSFHRVKKNTELPFVPYIGFAYIIVILSSKAG